MRKRQGTKSWGEGFQEGGGGGWTSEGGGDEKGLSQRVAGLVLLQQE
jgi:hypothetical protein